MSKAYKLSVDSKGRQWWRIDCSDCHGERGCYETIHRPTGPYVCIDCAYRRARRAVVNHITVPAEEIQDGCRGQAPY